MATMYSVYALRDPRTLTVYYIGMSSNAERRFKNHLRHNASLAPWIEELRSLGLQPELFIEEEAHEEALVRSLASFAPEDAKILSPFFKAGWDRFGSTAWNYTFSIVQRTLALCLPHTLQDVARLTWRVMDEEGDDEQS